jgi:hypothetical protein
MTGQCNHLLPPEFTYNASYVWSGVTVHKYRHVSQWMIIKLGYNVCDRTSSYIHKKNSENVGLVRFLELLKNNNQIKRFWNFRFLSNRRSLDHKTCLVPPLYIEVPVIITSQECGRLCILSLSTWYSPPIKLTATIQLI